jgi:2-polyprenyl-3-methyl-5-hydroxy-6-metoxy-1,4-benzoquinol methylase
MTSQSTSQSATGDAPRNATEEKAFYDDMWSRYGHLETESPAAIHRRRLVVDLASRAVAPTARVLDVGCGQGELLRDLAARLPQATISGADLSEESLRLSRAANPTFELFALNLADPDFASRQRAHLGAFDLVTCCEVLEHIPDHETAARNIASLLAPGGSLIATVPGGKMSRFDVAIGHQRHYDEGQLRALLTTAGLSVQTVLAWGFPFHNLYRSAVRLASRISMPGGPAAPTAEGRPSLLSGLLSTAYVTVSRILHPLFYLNRDRGGEQMIAVAHVDAAR